MANTYTDAQQAEFMTAIRKGETEQVRNMLARHRDLSRSVTSDGQTPLHQAAEFNDPGMGVLLLQHGADPNQSWGDSGHTPLSWAVTCNSRHFAFALVKEGVVPDLFCSAGMGLLPAVEGYFKDGKPIPGASKTGCSRYRPDGSYYPRPPETDAEVVADALYIACRNAHEPVVRYLLTRQPDLGFRAYMGGNLLHWSYFGNSPAVIDLIKQAGVDETARDDVLHCTPRAFGICTAASWGFLDLVERQLQRDPALATLVDGSTSAINEARKKGHTEIVNYLQAHGAV